MNNNLIAAFLSYCDDTWKKGFHYRKNTAAILERSLARVPSNVLQVILEDYKENDMSTFAMNAAEIKRYVREHRLSQEEWFLIDRGVYCRNCRTDEEGKEGGWRVLWARYQDTDERGNTKQRSDTWSCRCDCEPAQTLNGVDWRVTARRIRAQDPNAAIRWDHWCGPECQTCASLGLRPRATEGRMRATLQSDQIWEHRVKSGYFTDEGGEYAPNWDHSIWLTSIGHMILREIEESHGVRLLPPEHVREARRKRATKDMRKDKFDALARTVIGLYNDS